MYETFEHTADMGLRIRAHTLEELFAEAGRGFFALIATNLDAVKAVCQRDYEIGVDEVDYQLFDWLNELLYTFESDKLVLADFQVRIDAGRIRAVAGGEPFDAERHGADHEVKAITYHGLRVEKQQNGWLAEVIVDI
jgi:SHS2 domain-containing protein